MHLSSVQRGQLIFSLILMFAGLALAIYGFNNQTRFDKLAQNSTSVLSQPLQFYQEARRNGQVTYVIEPSFVAQDGKTYTCKAGISKETMTKLEDSLTVMVNYVPDNPTLCKVEGALVNEDSNDSEGAMWAGGLTALGSVIYMWRKGLRQPKKLV